MRNFKFYFKANFIIILTLALSIILPMDGFAVYMGDDTENIQPEYVKGEIIVKFKENKIPVDKHITKAGRILLDSKQTGLNNIDKLNKKFDVKEVAAVYQNLKRKQIAQAKDLNQIYQETVNKYPVRSNRSLYSGKIPNISDTYIVRFKDKNVNVKELSQIYQSDPNVEYAEPNYINYASRVNFTIADPGGGGGGGTSFPDDPFFYSSGSFGQDYEDMWGLKRIQAKQGWNLARGQDVIVAVIDTGVDYTHEDINSNMWTNSGEIPDNGIDDDGNGFVDDYYGYNFAYGTSDPMDDHGHGTHCAGTIAAVGNNSIGVIGVAPSAKLMAVKSLSADGGGYSSDLANGIVYAANMGADVLSNSWGNRSPVPASQAVKEAVDYAYALGATIVAAAGNADDDVGTPIHGYGICTLSKVITVAASNQNDEKCSFSNYGNKIDVSAPGGGDDTILYNILSTMSEGTISQDHPELFVSEGYSRLAGTSMACPHVSGLAALVLSKYPDFNSEQVRAAINQGSDDITTYGIGWDEYTGHGRINAYDSLLINNPIVSKISNLENDGYLYRDSAFQFRGTAMGKDFASYTLEHGEGSEPGSWVNICGPVTDEVTEINGLLCEYDSTQLPIGQYSFKLNVSSIGATYSDKVTVFAGVKEGWPQNVGWLPMDMVAGDINGDGKKELITSSPMAAQFSLGAVYAFQSNGEQLPNWPAGLREDAGGGTPALADLNGDGKLDVIVADALFEQASYLYAWDSNAQLIPGFPIELNGRVWSYTAPVITDLDKNGNYDIVLATLEGNLEVYEYNRFTQTINLKWSAPSAPVVPYVYESSHEPSVGDINRDGYPDIVTAKNDTVYAFDKNGNPLSNFPVTISGADIEGLTVLGNIAGDKDLEIVVTDSRGTQRTYAINSSGDIIVASTLYNAADISPVLADFNHDGRNEIVGNSFILDGQGQTISQWTLPGDTSFFNFTSPMVQDIDNDGQLEVIVYNEYDAVINAYEFDGSQVADTSYVNFPLVLPDNMETTSKRTPPILDDLDGNGFLDLVIAPESIYVFEIGTYNSSSAERAWPMAGRNHFKTKAVKTRTKPPRHLPEIMEMPIPEGRIR